MSDDAQRKEQPTVYDVFKNSVNMTAGELEKWLESEESQSVGITKGTTDDKKTDSSGDESTGHESGRHIVRILHAAKHELTDGDYAHMKKVNGYIKRHAVQKPGGDIEHSRWRYSLMNWGHDPLNSATCKRVSDVHISGNLL